MVYRLIFALALGSGPVHAAAARTIEPDWSAGAEISAPRMNPYGLERIPFAESAREGRLHALLYPVDVTGVALPWRALENFLDEPSTGPMRSLLNRLFEGLARIRDTDELFASVGLHAYPDSRQPAPYDVPFRGDRPPSVRMGVTLFEKDGAEVFTISCAACHSANLFGTKVIGLTNRFPKTQEFFKHGKLALGAVGPGLYDAMLGLTPEERSQYERTRARVKAIGVKLPAQAGLDTSLAQVALSLARRKKDDYASFDPVAERFPRAEKLKTFVADSKPAVWWNVKYKNRWLSDGSVVSGNPIFTNLLWNEIGRGTDLHELEGWLARNEKTIEELTTAVFSAEAPRFSDFFPAETIDLARAKRGEEIFLNRCAKCHGIYEKAWSKPDTGNLSYRERIATVNVRYPERTKVVDVGTDPNRYLGMKSLEQLNELAISKKNGIVIQAQKGYVPPPLVGIWARWPYFHNNSAPSLCAVLSPAGERPRTYYAGEALDRDRDFDSECNGYPVGDATPGEWKNGQTLYDTRREGLHNTGHEFSFKDEERKDLIRFLQTL